MKIIYYMPLIFLTVIFLIFFSNKSHAAQLRDSNGNYAASFSVIDFSSFAASNSHRAYEFRFSPGEMSDLLSNQFSNPFISGSSISFKCNSTFILLDDLRSTDLTVCPFIILYGMSTRGSVSYTESEFQDLVSFLYTPASGSPDTTIPTLSFIGSSNISLDVNDFYNELGATANDDIDGDISSSITITGNVDTSFPGTYSIFYNVQDSSGNNATQIQRIITVNSVNSSAPVITLLGSSSITLTEGSTFSDSGATASDDIDGNITSSILISGSVDTDTAGDYFIFYNVFDSDGNAATEVFRIITVNAAPVENVTSEQLEKTIITIALTAFSIFGFTTGMTFRFDS
jgi:hypothetical protein